MSETSETPSQQPQQPQQPPRLTLQALASALGIIDLASQRGSFRATELEGIGATYNSLKRFVEYQQNRLAQEESATESTPESTTESTPESTTESANNES
tara:strand:- start:1943 stop:2239 length:297 start_codon:yes stop_codon:yes gene_type:complete